MFYVFDKRGDLVNWAFSEATAREMAQGYRGGYYGAWIDLNAAEREQVQAHKAALMAQSY